LAIQGETTMINDNEFETLITSLGEMSIAQLLELEKVAQERYATIVSGSREGQHHTEDASRDAAVPTHDQNTSRQVP
jgi:hypothetical protein